MFSAIGLSLLVAARENDYVRIRVVRGLHCYALLQALTLARWPTVVDCCCHRCGCWWEFWSACS